MALNRRGVMMAFAAIPLVITTGSASAGACGLIETSHWMAEVLPGDGPGAQPVLVVTGRAVAPSAGWTVSLAAGPTANSMPPIQMIVLDAKAPSGVAASVLTDHELRVEIPGEPAYRAVRIVCDGEAVHEFRDVGMSK